MKLLLPILAAVLQSMAVASPAATDAMCSLNYAKAVPCRMSDRVDAAGTHSMRFVIGDRQIRFTGRAQTGWWSGRLNGAPAMGIELNRGHGRFSTLDLATSFDWWLPGQEHGRY